MNEDIGQGGETRLRREIGFTGSAFLSFNGIVGAGHLRVAGDPPPPVRRVQPVAVPAVRGCSSCWSPCPSPGLPPSIPARAGRSPTPPPSARGLVPGRLALLSRAAHRAGRQRQCLRHLCRRAVAAAGRRAGARGLIAALIGARHLASTSSACAGRFACSTRSPCEGAAAGRRSPSGAWSSPAGPAAPGPLPPLVGIEAAALIVLYAFVGFEKASSRPARPPIRSGPSRAR